VIAYPPKSPLSKGDFQHKASIAVVGNAHPTKKPYQLSTRPNLKIDNKLKSKRDKARIVSAIFCGDIRQFFILNF